MTQSGNQLEPNSVIEEFIKNPPYDFHPELFKKDIPGFITAFDLLTTLEEPVKRILNKIPFFNAFAKIFLRPKTLFLGTTVSEYLVYTNSPPDTVLCQEMLDFVQMQDISVMIVKDIPSDSPLLSRDENQASAVFLNILRESGFIISTGQALAYVPINFRSIDEYLGRLSAGRRKDLRRKLKLRELVSVKILKTGDPFFSDTCIADLYSLYENVYNQSVLHFDKLVPIFFKNILQDSSNNGVVFCYYKDDVLISFNLCFVHRDNLIDKYIGFKYPEATDCNLYFLSWFVNLEYALTHNLKNYIAGWTDPEVKASLGAKFTFTKHAVYLKNPVLRWILQRFPRLFESDFNALQEKVPA